MFKHSLVGPWVGLSLPTVLIYSVVEMPCSNSLNSEESERAIWRLNVPPRACFAAQLSVSPPTLSPLSFLPLLSVPCSIYFEPSVVRPLGQFSSRRQTLDTALIIGLFVEEAPLHFYYHRAKLLQGGVVAAKNSGSPCTPTLLA